MDVVHQEDAVAEAGERLLHPRPIEGRARGRGGALETLEHALFVALGLEASEEPGTRVREALVVEVDRVLRREHDAETERA